MSNSTSLEWSVDEALATSAHVLTRDVPGFAVPLFGLGASSNTLYVQIVRGGRVTDFELTNAQGLPILALPEPFTPVALGDRPVHVIVGPNGDLLVGTQAQLAPQITEFVADIDDPLTRLGLAEFCDLRSVSLDAASAAYRERERAQGSALALNWFMNVVLFRRIAEATLDSCVDEHTASAFEQMLDDVSFLVRDDRVVCHAPEPTFRTIFPNGMSLAFMDHVRDLLMASSGYELVLERTDDISSSMKRLKPLSQAELDQKYHYLLSEFEAPDWPRLWRPAWKGEDDREYLAALALRWLEEAAAGAEAQGLVLSGLLSSANSYAAEQITAAAQGWLRSDFRTPRWADIWARAARRTRLPPDLDEAALGYLSFVAEGYTQAHNVWTLVWSVLWETRPDLHQALSDLAAALLERLGNRMVFFRQVVSVQVGPDGSPSRFLESLNKWLSIAQKRGRGWAASLALLLRLSLAEDVLSVHADQWLSSSKMSSAWASVWLALIHPSGPDAYQLQMVTEKLLAQDSNFPGLAEICEVIRASPIATAQEVAIATDLLNRPWPSLRQPWFQGT